MGVKRRRSKRKEELDESAEAWLHGEPCGFVQFNRKITGSPRARRRKGRRKL
jgi:hypothetical protein